MLLVYRDNIKTEDWSVREHIISAQYRLFCQCALSSSGVKSEIRNRLLSGSSELADGSSLIAFPIFDAWLEITKES